MSPCHIDLPLMQSNRYITGPKAGWETRIALCGIVALRCLLALGYCKINVASTFALYSYFTGVVAAQLLCHVMLCHVMLRYGMLYKAKYTPARFNITRPCRSHFHSGMSVELPAGLHPCQHFA